MIYIYNCDVIKNGQTTTVPIDMEVKDDKELKIVRELVGETYQSKEIYFRKAEISGDKLPADFDKNIWKNKPDNNTKTNNEAVKMKFNQLKI